MACICSHVYVHRCNDSCRVVRTAYVNSKCFDVKVGMLQGSALNPLLFVIVTETISSEFRVTLPWKLLYANELVVCLQCFDAVGWAAGRASSL